jgi:hypothetical protein
MLFWLRRRIVLILVDCGSIDAHAGPPLSQRTECEETYTVPVEKADKFSQLEPFAAARPSPVKVQGAFATGGWMSSDEPLLSVPPQCPYCGAPTTLSSIEPAEPGYDRRSFRCTACRRAHSIKTKVEPEPPAADGP